MRSSVSAATAAASSPAPAELPVGGIRAERLATAVEKSGATTRRRWLGWMIGIAVALAAGAFWAWQTYGKAAPDDEEKTASLQAARQSRVVAVTTAPVTARSVERRISAVGTLRGFEEIEIATKVGGRVSRLSVDTGDVVLPGDELLRIDDADFQLALAQAERGLEMELAKFALKAPPESTFDVRTTPGVARAMLLEENAKRRLARVEALAGDATLSRGAIAEQELEQARTEFEVAQANTRQAHLEAAQILAAIRWRQSVLDTARQSLEDTKVLAPHLSSLRKAKPDSKNENKAAAAGAKEAAEGGSVQQAEAMPDEQVEYVVAARHVSEGEMLATMPPTSLFRLVVDRRLKLKAAIPERHMGHVCVGQRADLFVEAYPNEVFVGRVARIHPTVNEQNRTFEVEIHVANDDRRLRPGAFAKVEVLVGQDSDATTVPEEAVVQFAGVVKVFVVDEGAARATPIALGARQKVEEGGKSQIWIEAIGDLAAGQQVVTSGHSQLAEGTRVRVRQPLKAEAGEEQSLKSARSGGLGGAAR